MVIRLATLNNRTDKLLNFIVLAHGFRFQVQNNQLSLSETLFFQTKLVSSLVFTVDSSFVRNTKLLHVSLSCQPHLPIGEQCSKIRASVLSPQDPRAEDYVQKHLINLL